MQVRDVDVRTEVGYAVMAELRHAYHQDMSARYPGAEYGPSTLPAGLHPPAGAFLVLFDVKTPAGCVGLRPVRIAGNVERCAEGKSLFVRNEFRKRGGASLLVEALVKTAKSLNYQWLYANTGAAQPESQRLFRSLRFGFDEIDLFDTSNPLAAFAFRLDLRTVQKT